MPLIGAADASLRGLRSPEGDEQKSFWSSPFYCETLSFVENLRAAGVEVGLCALVYDDENGDWICPSLQGFTDYTENS